MRSLKVLGCLVILGVFCIPALIVGTREARFQEFSLHQRVHLSAWYVPPADMYGPNPDAMSGWRVKGTVTNTIEYFSVSCGTGFSGHSPVDTADGYRTVTSRVDDWDGMGTVPAPNAPGGSRQAIMDVLWLDQLPEPFQGYSGEGYSTGRPPKEFPSRYFTLTRADQGYPDLTSGDGETLSRQDRCNQLLSHKHFATFWASPVGWLIILGVIFVALYLFFEGRGGGGGGPIRGYTTKHRSGTGHNITLRGPSGTVHGHSTPSRGPGTSDNIWLFPPDN